MDNLIKCTKSELSKLMSWSSSRYNACKKSDAILDIIFHVEKGEDFTGTYDSGCYSEGAHGYGPRSRRFKCNFSGGHYLLIIKDGIARLYNDHDDHSKPTKKAEYVTISKPAKNKYFTGAKQIEVLEKSKYGIAPGIYAVEWETVGSFYFIYGPENQRRGIGKDECVLVAGIAAG